MPSTKPRRAIVIGAGMGGLAAAGALASHFAHVTVLERDVLAGEAAPRKGTPQCRQPHALLAGGLQALCEIFPGFDDDLARAGAAPVRQNLDIRLEQPGRDFMPRRDLGLPLSYFMTRPLLELTLRRRVQALGHVEIRSRAEVLGLVAGEAGEGVVGVRFDGGGGEETLAGDLVIDASGRGEPTLAFLEAAGFAPPEEQVVQMGLGYASVVLSPPRRGDDWLAAITMPEAPADRYGMFLLPIEGGRWMATIDSMNDAELPEDWPAFLARAKALRTPTLYEAIKDCAPLSEVARFRAPGRFSGRPDRLRRRGVPFQPDPWPGDERGGAAGGGPQPAAGRTGRIGAVAGGAGQSLLRRGAQRDRDALVVVHEL